jgi:CPA2 family monovalent cation:H+ antiporter-2
MQHEPWLKDFLVFLVAAGLIVPLFHRARIGAVLGFLLIGVVVGPYGLGRLVDDYPWIRTLTIEDRARVAPFAELGVMFLLFLIGLELSMSRLWNLRRLMLGVGGLQFALSALAIGTGFALMGGGTAPAIVLGLCLAMSSTAIVMQVLEEQGRLATPLGQLALAVLLFQDLMVAPVLFATEVIGREGQNVLAGLGSALLQAGGAVALIAGIGYFALRPLFRIAGYTGSRELILALALLIVIGMAGATAWLGMSAALGAFLAGLLLSETEYRHQIEIDLAPVKGLLLGLFFISVGMSIDTRIVWQQIGLVLLAVAGLYALKSAILYAVSRAMRVASPTAAESAILLAQAGEFGFVVVALAAANAVLPVHIAQLTTVVIGISMMATPVIAAVGRRLGQRLQNARDGKHAPGPDAKQIADHVVIGGFGRVGQTIGRLLDAENVPYVALDHNGHLVVGRCAAQARPCDLLRRRRATGVPGARRGKAGARLRRDRQRAARGRTHGGCGPSPAARRAGVRPRQGLRPRGPPASDRRR